MGWNDHDGLLQSLATDLNERLINTITAWQAANVGTLSALDTQTIVGIIDNCLLDQTSPDENDDDFRDDDEHEPIGQEAFENSYIGGGGAPDWENM